MWIGRYREDVIGANGLVRRIRRSVALGLKSEIPTKWLAERRMEVLLSRINAPSYRPGRMATVAEFADRWRTEVLAQRKPSTVKAAESHLRCYILPQLGKARLDSLGVEAQQTFVRQLSQQVSRKTVLNVLFTLSSICERVELNKLALPEHTVREESRFFSADEAWNIISMAEEPFRTMFCIAAMTGMRAGEVLGLQVDDIDLERRVLRNYLEK